MIKLDDSVLEYALYEILGQLEPAVGKGIPFETLRSLWCAAALPQCDLQPAIQMLVESGSVSVHLSDLKVLYLKVSVAGCGRASEVVNMASTTMADQVARSILKTLRDRVTPNAKPAALISGVPPLVRCM